MTIIPAILTDSMTEFHQQLEILQTSGEVPAVHVDIIDGLFVDNLTVTPLDLTLTDFDPLKIDFHFMTEEPMDIVYECAAVKDYLPIRSVIGQVERMSHQHDFLVEVRKHGWQPVLALDLFTPLEAIEPDVWSELTHILLMGVEAGHQAMQLHQHVYEKIQELRQKFPNSDALNITLDGGVNQDTIPHLSSLGVDQFVVGSAIWTAENPLQAIDDLIAL